MTTPTASGSELARKAALSYLAAYPADAAPKLDTRTPEAVSELLTSLSVEARAELLRRMNAHAAAKALAALDVDSARDTLLTVDPARAAKWLSLLEEPVRAALLKNLPTKPAQHIQDALTFPPGTAGHLMDAGVVSFREDTTIQAAFTQIRELKRRVVDVLVCDDDDKLTGVVALQELVGAPLQTSLGSLAKRSFPSVHSMASRDEVVELLTQHRVASLPVLDLDGRLLGTIRYDALVLAAQEARAEDLQTMVGAGKEERALSSPWVAIKSRLPWLFINLLTAFAAAFVVGLFDETIAKFTALAVLLPVVAGQSGNTGAQALAVTSRGLALREVRIFHWWRVLIKEVSASLANGVAIAAVTSGSVLVVSGNAGLAMVIGISMVISMVMAAIAGAMIPVLLTAAGRDPATASSIILTTVTDIAGFFSFLGLATLFMDMLAG